MTLILFGYDDVKSLALRFKFGQIDCKTTLDIDRASVIYTSITPKRQKSVFLTEILEHFCAPSNWTAPYPPTSGQGNGVRFPSSLLIPFYLSSYKANTQSSLGSICFVRSAHVLRYL